MPNLPIPQNLFASARPNQLSPLDRRIVRRLSQMDRSAMMQSAQARYELMRRMAAVEAEAMVSTVKSQEVDRVAEAISGQAMLRRYSDTVAQGDPMLSDELRFFADMARLGKGEIIADLVTDYCRESRLRRG